jgi:hypothetical protein
MATALNDKWVVLDREEKDRLTREALAELEKNGAVPHAEVQAWAESLLTDKPLPLPSTRRER